ncbi:MAG: succinate dehydrogenase cytochrome b subunit [Saprospiraceae bacterium]|nr:succinate dehydrogenase cytochrome b subunit [Saprospiraceae bacterium]
MNWFLKFLTSSLGQKVIMSLTGLFLVLFLVVHLAGNLQLLLDDGGEAFNVYTKKMTTSPIIKVISYGNYFFILLHAFQGILLYFKNRKARGSEAYAVKVTKAVNTNSFAASNMAWLGLLILVFLGIHMGDFWYQMKWGEVPTVVYHGDTYENLYLKVEASFSNIWIVLFYCLSMLGLAFHLTHGFQSAFQSLGLNHPKYSPFIRGVGKVIGVIIPIGFAIIPLYYFFLK